MSQLLSVAVFRNACDVSWLRGGLGVIPGGNRFPRLTHHYLYGSLPRLVCRRIQVSVPSKCHQDVRVN